MARGAARRALAGLTHAVGSLRWDVTLVLLGMTACWVLAAACAPRAGLAAVLAAVASPTSC